MKERWSVGKTGRTNVQKTHGWSQLRIFGTDTCAWAPTHGMRQADPTCPNAFSWAPTHDTIRPTRTKFGVPMDA